jgi:hypothetical protein
MRKKKRSNGGLILWLHVIGTLFWVVGALGLIGGILDLTTTVYRMDGVIDLSGEGGTSYIFAGYCLATGAMMVVGSAVCFALAAIVRSLSSIEASLGADEPAAVAAPAPEPAPAAA